MSQNSSIFLFLLAEGAVASNYGIGTFCQQLTECVVNCSDIHLTFVEFQCREVTEYTVQITDTFKKIKVPVVNHNGSDKSVKRYYANAWRLIRGEVPQNGKLVFHLNYYQEYPLINIIKSDYPDCRFCFTIHYQLWAFSLKGNVSLFKKILHKDESERVEREKTIVEEFMQDKKLFEAVDKVVCMSKFTEQLLLDEYDVPQDKLACIYNGLKDEYVPLSPSERTELRRKLFFDDNKKIILFVGRLSPEKGVDYLIKAFRIVLEKVQCHLVIVGDGNISHYLKECSGIWRHITLTGRLEKEQLYSFYQIADVGVMPSFHEQCSYVAMEMLMFNVPLVISTSTGLGETLIDGKSKVPVMESDTDTTISAEELSTLILDKLKKAPSEENRNLFLQKYNLTDMGRNYLECYRQIS